MKEYAHPPPPPPEARHPLSQKVRAIALSLPGAWEDHPWGDIVFKIGDKMFATTHHSGGGVTVKANPAELDELLQRPGIMLAPYVGRFGWIQMTFDSEEALPFVEQLMRASFDLVSMKSKGKKKKKEVTPQS